MNNLNLSEKSKNYYEENDVYEIFSIAEDYPNKIYKYLLPKVKNKIVLDLGCGTGKFMQKFYKEADKYYGLDLSNEQLKIAKEKVERDNVQFICCSAENIPLPNNSIDVIISTWVLGTILEVGRRNKVLDEMKRVLKKDGSIYLVENDIGGEFEEIRNRYPDIKKTKDYNDWIELHDFICDNKFKTYFKFDNENQAKKIFSNIWGENIGKKVKSKIIEQNIIIYKYEKRNYKLNFLIRD